MPNEKLLTEKDLTKLAKQFRELAHKSRAQAGRELGVSHVSIYRAEENPNESLTKLRIRIIEAYSTLKVVGPVFRLEWK
jgi:DNA-binding XRE family transcriptional regulator